MSKYTYRVVSSNGAGSYGAKDHATLRAAKAKAHEIRAANFTPEAIEIERVETTPSGGHRYSMRRRGRWVQWDASQDAEQRQPDFCLRRDT